MTAPTAATGAADQGSSSGWIRVLLLVGLIGLALRRGRAV